MSDLVALVCTVVFTIWFVASSSVLAANLGGTRVPKIARLIASYSGGVEGRWQRRYQDGVATIFLVTGQATALALVVGNWGRASVSVTLILAAEPVLAVAWAVYLARAASSRQV